MGVNCFPYGLGGGWNATAPYAAEYEKERARRRCMGSCGGGSGGFTSNGGRLNVRSTEDARMSLALGGGAQSGGLASTDKGESSSSQGHGSLPGASSAEVVLELVARVPAVRQRDGVSGRPVHSSVTKLKRAYSSRKARSKTSRGGGGLWPRLWLWLSSWLRPPKRGEVRNSSSCSCHVAESLRELSTGDLTCASELARAGAGLSAGGASAGSA